MKLRFSIQYSTAWGESLHIRMEYRSLDGTVKQHDYTMLTEDGNLWTLETAALESRHHPISEICYLYEVQDADGNTLRREWDLVPRRYAFDSTKDYTFPDQWRDCPLCAHLYTKAYAVTALYPVAPSSSGVGKKASHRGGLEGTPINLPLFRQTLIFRVSAPQLKPGQALAICGSHPAIGSWNTSRYLRMEYAGQYEWMLSVDAFGMLFPLEYKYVVIDDASHSFVAWEEGENRVVEGLTPSTFNTSPSTNQLNEGAVLVLYGERLRIREDEWRAAGVAVPVFSLRSEHSYGVGDFGDLRRFVDWAAATGMRVIQTLPVNDTTLTHRWGDSYPYNIVSAFALHPHYLDLEGLGTLKSKTRMTAYHRQRRELNALPYSDYEAVDRVKLAYVREFFDEQGQQTLQSADFKQWQAENDYWLKDYVAYLSPKLGGLLLTFIQYHLHLQLKAAADYAREKGLILKGDLPIGVNRESVETKAHPELFHLDSQTGAPPDSFSVNGQNWGFPTYNWLKVEDGGLTKWFRQRLHHMEQYFDAMRIDHVLGFFRIWEIPNDAVHGVLGHFSPALPLTVGEIEYFGMPFRRELYTQPYINDRIIERTFGIHAQFVREHFLLPKAYGLYDLKEEYHTQRQVEQYFIGKTDEHSVWIRDGLYRLIANVLFVEDPRQAEMFHPRIGALYEPIFQSLSDEQKDAYMRLYNNYFFQRHNFYWGATALKRLPAILHDTQMLICAEDLGMLPDCVQPVLDQLRIFSLEIQALPKQQGEEFGHVDAYPKRSVCTISTHDMAPLRLWWEENPERAQRYYITMLQKEGRAPQQLPAHLAEEIIARHLYCPSMLCVLQLQDWLSMDGELRGKDVRSERINTPSDPYNRWQWRMHLTIEDLLAATKYNNKVKTMISRSRRMLTP